MHDRNRGPVLTALPCVQLQHQLADLIDKRVWNDIRAATQLTPLSLLSVLTASQQADVASAVTALPDLQEQQRRSVNCGGRWQLSDGSLLWQLTKVILLDLQHVTATALEHLCSLDRLQHLAIDQMG